MKTTISIKSIISKYFVFEKKVGWPEIIALFALVISIISINISYKSYKINFPDIEIREITPSGGPYFDKNENKYFYLTYSRFIITNNGGRPVNLIGFDELKELPSMMIVKNGKLSPAQNVLYKIIQVQESLDVLKGTPSIVSKYKNLGMDGISILNERIEEGDTYILNMLMLFDVYENNIKNCEFVLSNFNLIFGNDYKHHYKRGFPISDISD